MRGIGWLNIIHDDNVIRELLNDLRFLKNASNPASGSVVLRNLADSELCDIYNWIYSGCGSTPSVPLTNSIWDITTNDTGDATGFYPFNGATEGPFIFNTDIAAQVQTQLEAIPTFTGNVLVTGGPLPATVTVEFINVLAGTNPTFNFAGPDPPIGADPTFTQTQVGSMGPGAVGDAFTAIDWTAAQPWKTGVDSSGADEFLGVWTEDWQGLEGEFARTVNDRGWAFGGANFTPLRPKHLSMTFTVVLGATTERGLQYGFRWLSSVLYGLDSCDRADLVVFDHCPPAATAEADWIWWFIRDAGVLDMPRWGDIIIDELNCKLRRVTFVLGARDPHKYRCPVLCTAQTEFTVPDPATACAPDYSWAEWFCNDNLDSICCTIDSPSFDYTSRAAVIIIRAGATGSPPMEISWADDSFRITPLLAFDRLEIDSSRHEIRYFPDGPGVTGDGSGFVSAAFGKSPVWAEISSLLQSSSTVCVRPLRICGLAGTSVEIQTVDRV